MTDVSTTCAVVIFTVAQVVETSVTANNNNPIQDYVHPDDQTQPTFKITMLVKDYKSINIYKKH